MNCDMDYCIYNRHFCCILSDIRINSLGMCDDCIMVIICDDNLKEMKQKQFDEIESRWDTDTNVE